MVKWNRIEDNGALPTRVWLSRTKPEDENAVNPEEWKPLRKVDSKKLNDVKNRSAQHGHCPVLIESGRSTADPDFGIIRANFVPKPPRELTSCTWFVVTDEKKDPQTGKLRPVLEPMPDDQSERVEDMYQRAVYAASVYGEGIEPLLKEKPPLGETCPDHHVEVCLESGSYLMRKVPNGWFARSFPLQRGHGNYTVEGEEEEEMLGPINHVVFVIHGIGENWFAKDKSLSMVEQMDQLRLTFQKRQIADWKKKCDAAVRKKEPKPDPPNRVEFLPILWYDRLHDTSNVMTKSLMGVTLNTIPALRNIANDVVLDVLLYMTPTYCFDVLESVTDQIYSVHGVFNKTFPDFRSRGGKCSLIGHSLGSVICWDLLSLKKKAMQRTSGEHAAHLEASVNTAITSSNRTTRNGLQQQRLPINDVGAWGPSLPEPYENVLPFEPEFTMFVGSPIGLFLSLRGAHGVFDSIREALPNKPRVSPFTLPTKAVYNIFSPSDPVAYRIEPLLLVHGTATESLPEPVYLTRLGEGVRLHVKAQQLVGFFTQRISYLSRPSVTEDDQDKTTTTTTTRSAQKDEPQTAPPSDSENEKNENLVFPLGGRSQRLDYQLQPSLIDNEYIKAVTAHSTYFQNTDIIDFAIDITGRDDKEVIDLTGTADETWEEVDPSKSGSEINLSEKC